MGFSTKAAQKSCGRENLQEIPLIMAILLLQLFSHGHDVKHHIKAPFNRLSILRDAAFTHYTIGEACKKPLSNKMKLENSTHEFHQIH